jgi:hypothetical protein
VIDLSAVRNGPLIENPPISKPHQTICHTGINFDHVVGLATVPVAEQLNLHLLDLF